MPAPTREDEFGRWNLLGEIIPVPTGWTKFPYPALDIYGETFRLIFRSSDWINVNSFAWIRQRFNVLRAESIVTQAQRIYPKQENLIIQFPVSPDFEHRGLIFFDIEVRKVLKNRVLHRLVQDAEWSLEIHELQT